MDAREEVAFELTNDLRDRILKVHSEADAVALLHGLGVRGPLAAMGTHFVHLAGLIRDTERRYGCYPLDFSHDPLMGLGRFNAFEAKFERCHDSCRPVVGIRVLLGRIYPNDPTNEWRRFEVLPVRAEPSEVVIPEGIAGMDGMGFMGCSRIQRVTIPSSMREIPGGAFWGCAGLVELVVPEEVAAIGPAAFAGCEGLRRVVLPASLEHIGCGAFVGCTSLEEVVAPAGLSVPRAAHAFDGCKLPADSYCRMADRPVDRERALKDLDKLLRDFGRMLDGPNSVHSLGLVDADAPGPDDVREPVNDTIEAIRQTLENTIIDDSWYLDDYDKIAEEDMLLLSRLIVDTLDSTCDGGAKTKAYEPTPAFRKECEKWCYSLDSAIMIQTGDEWRGLMAGWSD